MGWGLYPVIIDYACANTNLIIAPMVVLAWHITLSGLVKRLSQSKSITDKRNPSWLARGIAYKRSRRQEESRSDVVESYTALGGTSSRPRDPGRSIRQFVVDGGWVLPYRTG